VGTNSQSSRPEAPAPIPEPPVGGVVRDYANDVWQRYEDRGWCLVRALERRGITWQELNAVAGPLVDVSAPSQPAAPAAPVPPALAVWVAEARWADSPAWERLDDIVYPDAATARAAVEAAAGALVWNEELEARQPNSVATFWRISELTLAGTEGGA
jgi:hypothetical protein